MYQLYIHNLHSLHEMRRGMSAHSLYHAQYESMCIELNTKLYELTGRNYSDYSSQEIENAIAEYQLLKEE